MARKPARVPRPKKPSSKTPKRVLTTMEKNGLSKIWEVRKISNSGDKAFTMMTEPSPGKFKLIKFGSKASSSVRFDSTDRRTKFRTRHGCDTRPPKLGTPGWAACQVLWHQNDKPRTVRNCSNCGKK